jgi:hypothetical protein
MDAAAVIDVDSRTIMDGCGVMLSWITAIGVGEQEGIEIEG